jgi:methionyl-tRNA formyltransferase|tara:strand:- start:3538 stop:4176 length:639 start_codon:yes stop_codon:yes gene_type:complete
MQQISFLVNNPDSWIIPFLQLFLKKLSHKYNVSFHTKSEELPYGDISFYLGCTLVVPSNIMKRNKLNLVVHASDLPWGRGMSPVSWQILEGKDKIPIVLFRAVEKLDAGDIYLRDSIHLDGTELLPEIRAKVWKKTEKIILHFLKVWPNIIPEKQKGAPTFYCKRTDRDDEINPNRTIIENFNHLRIIDNDRYPAWFTYKGEKYILKIYKAK